VFTEVLKAEVVSGKVVSDCVTACDVVIGTDVISVSGKVFDIKREVEKPDAVKVAFVTTYEVVCNVSVVPVVVE